MQGHEVKGIAQNQATRDDDKSREFLSAKLHIFNVAYHNFESAFHRAVSPDSATYGFIPFPCGAFVEMLMEAAVNFKMERKKFLDVGSGPGTKVTLANVLFDAHGLEFNETLVEAANRMGISNVFQADALEYEQYSDYDLLYFYRPFKDDKMQFQMEERIVSQMKSGALIAPMHVSPRWDELEIKRYTQYLYVKE